MARILDIEIPPIEYLDENSNEPVGTVEFSHSNLFHPAIIEAADNPVIDPTSPPTQAELEAANKFAKEFATRKGLTIAQDAHVGNIIPKFIDQTTGKEFVGGQGKLPPRTIMNINQIPTYVKDLQWDDKSNIPYYIDKQTSDIQYVHPDIFFSSRFNPYRGKSKEDLIVKK